eukprot:CAMPEP_0181320692 /NCGR_PEP_ID=MMETSP1101-20121128/18263_1 /TAXON_ID=46948 /ORGANISM="Rhodomonas abbreviata, Strain Caron Lab Isolate" /LENGTH=123 /DNA_ID=CAMNT_0023428421 /DNA_START=169 /DNA_END=540 /DNA_ORIENTATION=+
MFIISRTGNDLSKQADVYSATTFYLSPLWQFLDVTVPTAFDELFGVKQEENISLQLLLGGITYKSGVGVVTEPKEDIPVHETEWWERAPSFKGTPSSFKGTPSSEFKEGTPSSESLKGTPSRP